MMRVIDICSDLGEGFGNYSVADDERIIRMISSANIACGFHAGDPRTMYQTVKNAVSQGIGIGAHPGYPDLAGFGRRNMDLSDMEVMTDVLYQIGALDAFVRAHGGRLQHVFPHGQLGLRANSDRRYAEAIVEAVCRYDSSLIVMTQKGQLADAAGNNKLKVAIPLFVDRAYGDDGNIVPRSRPGAVIKDPDTVVERSLKMVLEQKVTTVSGQDINIVGHTLLIHGDTDGSPLLAENIREALGKAGVAVRPLGEWLK